MRHLKIYERFSLDESIQRLDKAQAKSFVNYCIDNFNTAKSAINKLKKYTENWKIQDFTKSEIKFVQDIPGAKALVGKKVYRGINSNRKPSSKVYMPDQLFTSWTLKKNNTEFFTRGPYLPLILTTTIKDTTNYIDVSWFFANVNAADLYLYEKSDLNKDEKKVAILLDGIQLYDESEIIIFDRKIILDNEIH